MPQPTDSTDERLVRRYQLSGDQRAVEELVRRHLPRVNRLAFQMVMDEAAADDLTQETFLRALRSLDRFQNRSSFATWLFRITMNTIYGHLRETGRSRLRFGQPLPERPGREPAPEALLLQGELKDKIQAALAELSPRLRTAIVLVVLQRFGVKEAAEIEGCTRATMYWRVHKARRRLQAKLREYLSS